MTPQPLEFGADLLNGSAFKLLQESTKRHVVDNGRLDSAHTSISDFSCWVRLTLFAKR